MSFKSMFRAVKRALPAILVHAPAVIIAARELKKAMKGESVEEARPEAGPV